MAGLFLQVAELSVSAAWMIPAVCALRLIPRAASHAPGAVLSGGAGAQSADAAGSVSGIAPAADLSEPELGFVLAHERAHLRRRDHIWKPLGWLLLSVHWFNPLVWLAYALFCRDVEYACDESVVGGLDADGRRAYARALLECSSPRRAAACAVLAVCFLTEPKPAEPALPEGLSLSEYEGDILCGGRMILPMVYEDMGSAPDYWRSSGVIADFNAAQCLLVRYIAEPGASTGMLVSLEASRFSAEDTVRLAQSLSR